MTKDNRTEEELTAEFGKIVPQQTIQSKYDEATIYATGYSINAAYALIAANWALLNTEKTKILNSVGFLKLSLLFSIIYIFFRIYNNGLVERHYKNILHGTKQKRMGFSATEYGKQREKLSEFDDWGLYISGFLFLFSFIFPYLKSFCF